MAPKFYSKEWLEAIIEKANNDEKYRAKAEKHDASYLFIVVDCPDDNDVKVLINFNKGKVSHKEYEVEPAPAGFRTENTPWDESISLIRAQGNDKVEEVLATGAKRIILACPSCKINVNDAITAVGADLNAIDITELVVEAL